LLGGGQSVAEAIGAVEMLQPGEVANRGGRPGLPQMTPHGARWAATSLPEQSAITKRVGKPIKSAKNGQLPDE